MQNEPIVIAPQRLRLGVTPLGVQRLILAHQMLPSAPQDIDGMGGTGLHSGSWMPQTVTGMELAWRSPSRFLFKLHSTTFTQAWQELTLRPVPGGTELVLAAGFTAPGGTAYEEYRTRWEEAARSQLVALATLVYKHTSSTQTLHDLLATVQAQEEAEWGHPGHSRGVERVAVGLAQAVILPSRQVEQMQQAAQLHDIGKSALSTALWAQRRILSARERAAMQPHAQMGALLAAQTGLPEAVQTAIRHHHERWDGRGYPEGLAGQAIPLKARILFLAESIDSMLRPSYRRQALSPQQVVARLQTGAGREWDPLLVGLAIELVCGRRRASAPVEISRLRRRGRVEDASPETIAAVAVAV